MLPFYPHAFISYVRYQTSVENQFVLLTENFLNDNTVN